MAELYDQFDDPNPKGDEASLAHRNLRNRQFGTASAALLLSIIVTTIPSQRDHFNTITAKNECRGLGSEQIVPGTPVDACIQRLATVNGVNGDLEDIEQALFNMNPPSTFDTNPSGVTVIDSTRTVFVPTDCSPWPVTQQN